MAGAAWRNDWINSMWPSMPQVPRPIMNKPWIKVGVLQKNGSNALMIRLLMIPVRKLLVVGLSMPVSLRVNN
ncbi:hypothetical protein D3C81_1765120 [compost metagenome]